MTDFDKPSAEQLRILSFLLSENFVGGVELRKQIAYCSTRAHYGVELKIRKLDVLGVMRHPISERLIFKV